MTTALLVIDMQNIFLDMTTTALPNILTLCAHFNLTHRPLILTQHGHPPADLTPPFKNQLVRKWGPTNSIATGTPEWSSIPAIALLAAPPSPTAPAATVIAKTTYDAFLNTTLSSRLDELGVSRVVVCGVMTDCCCDTTARSAFNRGYETWLVGDACGSANEGQHEAGLRAFGYAFGEVLGTGEVLRRLGGGGAEMRERHDDAL